MYNQILDYALNSLPDPEAAETLYLEAELQCTCPPAPMAGKTLLPVHKILLKDEKKQSYVTAPLAVARGLREGRKRGGPLMIRGPPGAGKTLISKTVLLAKKIIPAQKKK